LGEYKDCYDDYFKLEKIKKEYSKGGKSWIKNRKE
jgi:hypothetical protein